MKTTDPTDPIQAVLSVLPESPGVYQYFDAEGTIIYVGKAKNLKRRVSSYFNKRHDSRKTAILVRHIREIKYIVVPSEEDALHLENNLIKELQPRYNVLLKDDKTYPSLCVRNEHFPRILLTRKITKDGSKYYGPYANVPLAKTVLALIRELYPLRTCKYALTPENVARGRFSRCLQYHIKRCNAPCEGRESEAAYRTYIEQAHQILKGDTSQLAALLKDEMMQLAGQQRFEEAQILKEKYLLLEKYRAKTVVVSNSIHDVDVFSFEGTESHAYINYIHVRQGAVVQSYTIAYKKRIDEEPEEILALGIAELRNRFGSTAREVIVPFLPAIEAENFRFTVPQKGDKRKLLEISEQNVRQYKIDKLKQAEKLNPEQRVTRILGTLQRDLRLKELPLHIECFDNSNIQGTNPVASCVVFKKAKPAKKEYRHFNIRTVVGPDDFASMQEIVGRRYKRLLEEESPLPQLIVVDGGKGQLHAAVTALQELGLIGKIPIIGIAKRLEEIYFPEDPVPLYLDKNSESLRLIQQLRDEAHRFGVTHHRNRRSKTQVTSALDRVPGVGAKSKEILLTHYKSVKRIAAAPLEELSELVGKTRAEALKRELAGAPEAEQK